MSCLFTVEARALGAQVYLMLILVCWLLLLILLSSIHSGMGGSRVSGGGGGGRLIHRGLGHAGSALLLSFKFPEDEINIVLELMES